MVVLAIEEEGVPWYYEIMKFLELGIYPDGANKECCLVIMMAMQYILFEGRLYRRSYYGFHLHCLKKEEAKRIMEEVHQGICGPHISGKMLAKKILRMGYYWNRMETDCIMQCNILLDRWLPLPYRCRHEHMQMYKRR